MTKEIKKNTVNESNSGDVDTEVYVQVLKEFQEKANFLFKKVQCVGCIKGSLIVEVNGKRISLGTKKKAILFLNRLFNQNLEPHFEDFLWSIMKKECISKGSIFEKK